MQNRASAGFVRSQVGQFIVVLLLSKISQNCRIMYWQWYDYAQQFVAKGVAMQIDPATLTERERYKILIGAVVPRPIAWVSSIAEDGTPNLAPFSYFNIACTDPPMLLFCPQRRG